MKQAKAPIKPLFSRHITLHNLSNFQDLIKRRSKATLSFKFTCLQKENSSDPIDDNITQRRVFKALKFLKVIKKADFSRLETHVHRISPLRTLAIFKRLSRVKSILVFHKRTYVNAHNNFSEKWLRYLPALRHLDYWLCAQYVLTDEQLEETRRRGPKEVKHPLRDLKYCPKIQSLELKMRGYTWPFLKSVYNFKQYPPKLKFLSIRPGLSLPGHLKFSFECLKNIQSLQFYSNELVPRDFTVQYFNALPNFVNLQELDLKFIQQYIPEIPTAFRKISERGTLKKLSLQSVDNDYPFKGALEALKDCQLTHLSLFLNTPTEKMFKPIAEFFKDKSELECLQVYIQVSGQKYFTSPDVFEEICKEINKLPALRKLTLHFQTDATSPCKTSGVGPTLVSYLQPTFTKTIKLEVLSLTCYEIGCSKEFQSLMTTLQGSTSSLLKLEVHFGSLYSSDPQVSDGVISFIQSLENIRVLKFPDLEIRSQKFLRAFAKAVQKLKYLRILDAGHIKGSIKNWAVVLDAIEAIATKRGLEEFNCKIPRYLKMSLDPTAPRIDKTKVMKINPAFQRTRTVQCLFNDDQNWDEDPEVCFL